MSKINSILWGPEMFKMFEISCVSHAFQKRNLEKFGGQDFLDFF